MAEPERTGVSLGKVVAIAVVVAALVGGVVGYVAGGLTRGPKQAAQERDFWVFTVVLPFPDSPATPHDYFAPDRMTVNVGDTVSIHFYNTETEPENHTYTMVAPYEINKIVPYNTTIEFSFVANTPGVYAYRCSYHQPTMTGWLVVLG